MEKLLTKLLSYVRYLLVFWIVSGILLIVSSKIISTHDIIGLKEFLMKVDFYYSKGVSITLLVNLISYVLLAFVKKK